MVMGGLTLLITCCNIALIVDAAVNWSVGIAAYFLSYVSVCTCVLWASSLDYDVFVCLYHVFTLFTVFTAIYGGVGFCNFYFARQKFKHGDEQGLHVCILVLFMIILPVAMVWSYFLTIISLFLNAVEGDSDGVYFAYYMCHINLINCITMLIMCEEYCVHMTFGYAEMNSQSDRSASSFSVTIPTRKKGYTLLAMEGIGKCALDQTFFAKTKVNCLTKILI